MVKIMILVETNTQHRTAPAGLSPATLTRVTDLGEEESQYGTREMLELEFELDAKDEATGEPYRAWRKCSKSLHRKSTLRGIVEGLLGRPLNGDETRRFDVESLVGRQCLIQVAHVEKNGRTFANITAVLPALQEEEEIGQAPS